MTLIANCQLPVLRRFLNGMIVTLDSTLALWSYDESVCLSQVLLQTNNFLGKLREYSVMGLAVGSDEDMLHWSQDHFHRSILHAS